MCFGDWLQLQPCNEAACPGPPRRCPGSSHAVDGNLIPLVECSGLGTCTRLPAKCSAANPACNAQCVCAEGATGKACSVPQTALVVRSEMRADLITALTNTVARIDVANADSVQRFADTLREVVGDGVEIVWAAGPGAVSVSAEAAGAAAAVLAAVDTLIATDGAGLTAPALDTLSGVVETLRAAAVGGTGSMDGPMLAAAGTLEQAASSSLAGIAEHLAAHSTQGITSQLGGSSSASMAATREVPAKLGAVQVGVPAAKVFNLGAVVHPATTNGVDEHGGLVLVTLTTSSIDPGAYMAVKSGSIDGTRPWSDNLLGPITNVQLWQDGAQISPSNLPEPLLFEHTLPQSVELMDVSCVYFDEVTLEWSTKGLVPFGGVHGSTVTCASTHATAFTIVRGGPRNGTSANTPQPSTQTATFFIDIWNASFLVLAAITTSACVLGTVLCVIWRNACVRGKLRQHRENVYLTSGTLTMPTPMPVADRASTAAVAHATWQAFVHRVRHEHVWVSVVASDMTHQLTVSMGQRLCILLCLLCTILGLNAVVVGARPTAPVWGLWVSFGSALALLPMLLTLPNLFQGCNDLLSVTHPSHPGYAAYKANMRKRAADVKRHGVVAVRDHTAVEKLKFDRATSLDSARDLMEALRNTTYGLALDLGLSVPGQPPVAAGGAAAEARPSGGVGASATTGPAEAKKSGKGNRRGSVAAHYSSLPMRMRKLSSLLNGSGGLQSHLPALATVTQQLLWDAERELEAGGSDDDEGRHDAHQGSGSDSDSSGGVEFMGTLKVSSEGKASAPPTPVINLPSGPTRGGKRRGGRRKSAIDRLGDLAGILLDSEAPGTPASLAAPTPHSKLIAELQKWSDSYRLREEAPQDSLGLWNMAAGKVKDTPEAAGRRASLLTDVMRLQSFYGSEYVDDGGHVDAVAAFQAQPAANADTAVPVAAPAHPNQSPASDDLEFFSLKPAESNPMMVQKAKIKAKTTTGWGSIRVERKVGEEGNDGLTSASADSNDSASSRSRRSALGGGLGVGLFVAGVTVVVGAAAGLNPRGDNAADWVSLPVAALGAALTLMSTVACRLAHLNHGCSAVTVAAAGMVLEVAALALLVFGGDHLSLVIAVAVTHGITLLGLAGVWCASARAAKARRGKHRRLSAAHFVVPTHTKRDQERWQAARHHAARLIQRLEYRRRAVVRVMRRSELNAYIAVGRERAIAVCLCYFACFVYSSGFAVTGLWYGTKFTRGLLSMWTTTCVASLILDIVVVEPLLIVVRAFLYDTRRMFQRPHVANNSKQGGGGGAYRA